VKRDKIIKEITYSLSKRRNTYEMKKKPKAIPSVQFLNCALHPITMRIYRELLGTTYLIGKRKECLVVSMCQSFPLLVLQYIGRFFLGV